MPKRYRCQIGERISPVEPQPSKCELSVSCPICFRRSWWHRLFDRRPDGAGGTMEATDPWKPLPLMYRAMRRYPRKPDGSRGFHWETVPDHDFQRANPEAVALMERRFAIRMIAWLRLRGYIEGPRGGRSGR